MQLVRTVRYLQVVPADAVRAYIVGRRTDPDGLVLADEVAKTSSPERKMPVIFLKVYQLPKPDMVAVARAKVFALRNLKTDVEGAVEQEQRAEWRIGVGAVEDDGIRFAQGRAHGDFVGGIPAGFFHDFN